MDHDSVLKFIQNGVIWESLQTHSNSITKKYNKKSITKANLFIYYAGTLLNLQSETNLSSQ